MYDKGEEKRSLTYIASPSSEQRRHPVILPKFDKGRSAERKVAGAIFDRTNTQTIKIAEENVRLLF